MDGLYPERAEVWQNSLKRSATATIRLKDFSFLDNPAGTLTMLRSLVEAECVCGGFGIDFEDNHCLDIAPYMVLGLMRQQMLPIIYGGRMQPGIRSVLQAVDLDKFIRMRKTPNERDQLVFPFKMKQRRPTGSSTADNRSEFVTSEERVGTQFTETVDRWLGQLQRPRRLTRQSRKNFLTLICEVLDNAKRHGDLIDHDGSWNISGFMEVRARPDKTITHVCHLGIINEGSTIFESLQAAPEHMQQSLSGLTRVLENKYPRKQIDEEAIWTFSSLQDQVSRVPLSKDGAPGGFGMMTLIEAVSALGRSARADEQPVVTILSGGSCVVVKAPHFNPVRSQENHRLLPLNDSKRLDELPDPAYVFNVPHRLSGTCVSVRFHLDEAELAEAANRKDAHNA